MNGLQDESWDPLAAADDVDANVLASAKKRDIKNILKSYVSNYDPFSELIQNGMDAIEKRLLAQDKFNPKIDIIIDLKENSLEVVDNGCGFEESEFKSFLAPSISFKSGGKTRGNKGVGVTYIAYGFNELIIRTKNPYFMFQGELRRGREWIEDDSGTVARPLVKSSKTTSQSFDEIDQGSSFKIIFSGKFVRPANLGWYQAKTPDQWLYLLLIKTPLGSIDIPECRASRIKFDLTVIDKDGLKKEIVDNAAQYKFPHLEIKASPRLADIVDTQRKAINNGRDPSKAIERFRKSNGIYETYKTEHLIRDVKMSKEQQTLLNTFSGTAYGYFAYSTEIWDQLNDRKAGLRKGLRIIRGGLQLANNQMPQGELITIPLTKSIGHQNQAHVIVHFEGAEPDLGRKGFQPELKELAEQISIAIVRQLSSRREDILKSDSGAQADIDREKNVFDWIRLQEDHERRWPLHLNNQNFFLPTRKISILSVPQTEQDVIVLFSQLIAGGIIRGVRLLSTSQNTQYDGVFRFCADEPLSDYVFNEEKNPLGVIEEQLSKTYITQPKVIEYKFSLDGLVREFESGYKNEKEVDLAVFWEMGAEYQREYTILSYLDFTHIHHRTHHGLTHRLNSATSGFNVICLKELLQILNDSDEAQKYQIATYGNEI
jgi:hypothetical protein